MKYRTVLPAKILTWQFSFLDVLHFLMNKRIIEAIHRQTQTNSSFKMPPRKKNTVRGLGKRKGKGKEPAPAGQAQKMADSKGLNREELSSGDEEEENEGVNPYLVAAKEISKKKSRKKGTEKNEASSASPPPQKKRQKKRQPKKLRKSRSNR